MRICPGRLHAGGCTPATPPVWHAEEALMTGMATHDTMAAPDTIVLIHGFWVTPRSWEHWIEHYENRGFKVLAPAYPGFEAEVEALNADTTPIEALTVPAIIGKLESVVGGLDKPPILMGHSAGGGLHADPA